MPISDANHKAADIWKSKHDLQWATPHTDEINMDTRWSDRQVENSCLYTVSGKRLEMDIILTYWKQWYPRWLRWENFCSSIQEGNRIQNMKCIWRSVFRFFYYSIGNCWWGNINNVLSSLLMPGFNEYCRLFLTGETFTTQNITSTSINFLRLVCPYDNLMLESFLYSLYQELYIYHFRLYRVSEWTW